MRCAVGTPNESECAYCMCEELMHVWNCTDGTELELKEVRRERGE
jgi:hypothetical protein